jgi:predicted nucleic acid-binding protein
MDRLFLDTNILIDVGARRSPYYLDGLEVMGLVSEGLAEGALSALSLSNMAYVMQNLNEVSQIGFFRSLRKHLEVSPMGQLEVDRALKRGLGDFEDGLQWESALGWKATHLLTRNVKDFPVSRSRKVLTPTVYLSKRG